MCPVPEPDHDGELPDGFTVETPTDADLAVQLPDHDEGEQD